MIRVRRSPIRGVSWFRRGSRFLGTRRPFDLRDLGLEHPFRWSSRIDHAVDLQAVLALEDFDAVDDGVFIVVDKPRRGLWGVAGKLKGVVEAVDVVLLVFTRAGNGTEELKNHGSYWSFVLLRYYLDKRPFYQINSSARSD